MNEKKIGKYVAYASGEVILVVIGILIAIQLNNWKDQMRTKEKECTYMTSLGQDLQRQLESIEAQMQFESEVVKDAETVIASYHQAERFVVDTLFSKRINTLNNRFTFRESNSTYEELLSTGSMNIISNESFKSKLLNYYQMLTQYEQVITRNNTILDNHFVPVILGLATHNNPRLQIKMFKNVIDAGLMNPEVLEQYSKRQLFHEAIEEELSNPLHELQFLNLVQYRHRTSGVHLSLMLELKTLTYDLIDELQRYPCDVRLD